MWRRLRRAKADCDEAAVSIKKSVRLPNDRRDADTAPSTQPLSENR
jgi:hypothetical protein